MVSLRDYLDRQHAARLPQMHCELLDLLKVTDDRTNQAANSLHGGVYGFRDLQGISTGCLASITTA